MSRSSAGRAKKRKTILAVQVVGTGALVCVDVSMFGVWEEDCNQWVSGGVVL